MHSCYFSAVFVYCLLLLSGRKDVVEILLEAGIDPNCFDGASGMKTVWYRMVN